MTDLVYAPKIIQASEPPSQTRISGKAEKVMLFGTVANSSRSRNFPEARIIVGAAGLTVLWPHR